MVPLSAAKFFPYSYLLLPYSYLFRLLLKMKVFAFLFSVNYGLKVSYKRWALRSRLISRCRAFSERSIVLYLGCTRKWRLRACK